LRLFVSGIGTGIGKTVVSAILVKALKAEYWKPIQSGDLERTDTDTVAALCPGYVTHREAFRLKLAASPNISAAAEGLEIAVNKITLPQTKAPLIIEGAGGLLVPLSSRHTMCDLITHLQAEVILVSQGYLGCINHTLLSIEALRARRIPLCGIIFNGDISAPVEESIVQHSRAKVLGRIPIAATVDREFVAEQAKRFSL